MVHLSCSMPILSAVPCEVKSTSVASSVWALFALLCLIDWLIVCFGKSQHVAAAAAAMHVDSSTELFTLLPLPDKSRHPSMFVYAVCGAAVSCQQVHHSLSHRAPLGWNPPPTNFLRFVSLHQPSEALDESRSGAGYHFGCGATNTI